ncbi:RNA polymerase sigma factor SigJ [Solirubrobacter sp. CPCC 204708]|uniref:RNA polymerase sigma factor SigJ n=1 Tax=Solirubrobacter deserti TaxID=2282478 RepID=A0ABT4RD73_9ACTN|nr:RNA polymerase sigma factor SigJ [Solirubrobacter deserti]MBE2317751.1 RNA polymerase sigma factor SigJ [Solirubrobacter deserti]MDA0136472.1 RNA polymerase sigma factor SigJ [Solirubrobacter deserti]
MVSAADIDVFEAARPRLFGIAYRMLGSRQEAQELVQEAWLRWQGTDRSAVREPAAFLATTVTRLAINEAQSARARRETYIGPWLPEPVDTSADPALGALNGEALEVGVLMLLEKLSPAERASYVLHEAFDYSYREIADTLQLTEANARQLAARARKKLAGGRRAKADAATHRRLLNAIVAAAQAGDVAALERLLAEDVVTYADGGGLVNAARKPIMGRERVAKALVGLAGKFWVGASFDGLDANGRPALYVHRDGEPIVVASINPSEDGGVAQIFFQANPEKLPVTR